MNSSCVKPGNLTFATRFIAAYLFLKSERLSTHDLSTPYTAYVESAKRNDGMVDQKIFKTAKRTALIAYTLAKIA